MAARHEEIAEKLRRAIDREDYAVGSPLPTEADLAARYGISRGTARQAVAALTSRRSQSLAELCGFAQWARARGREQPVSHILRVRCLDGEPVRREVRCGRRRTSGPDNLQGK